MLDKSYLSKNRKRTISTSSLRKILKNSESPLKSTILLKKRASLDVDVDVDYGLQA